jgi:hypothetical protein
MTRHQLTAMALLGAALALPLMLAPSCSLQNSEGPQVTCADLECGRINACENGIIAQCVDGVTVKYHVCKSSAEDICSEDWQVEGEYKCLEFQTECEGCRPERTAGCSDATGGSGGEAGSSQGGEAGMAGGGSGGTGGTGGSGGTAGMGGDAGGSGGSGGDGGSAGGTGGT